MALLKYLALSILFVAWIVLAHLGSVGWGNVDFNAVLAILPIVTLVWIAASSLKRRMLAIALFGGGIAVVLVYWRQLSSQVAAMYYLQHLCAHLAMAAFFGRSLFDGRVPFITQLARTIEGDNLSEMKLVYTRKATLAWTVFFCVNALVSTVLFVLAPAPIWSLHANLMTGPLLVLMFVAEFVVRVVVLPSHERPSFMRVIRAYREYKSQPDNRAQGE